jgi:ADP-ribose pyrophosphatase
MKRTHATAEEHRTIFEGRFFQLDVDRVQLPSGHTVTLEVIRHPGSVVIVPMPSATEVILIRQYRYSIDRWIWELPAGTLKPAEDPLAGAARECEEEIGLVPKSLRRMGAFYPTPGFCDELMTFFRCSDLQPPAHDSAVQKDEDEDLEPRTFTLAEARRLVEAAEIVDMKTVVGLTLV